MRFHPLLPAFCREALLRKPEQALEPELLPRPQALGRGLPNE